VANASCLWDRIVIANVLMACVILATRKDVERCFNVLQSKWQIVANASCLWDRMVIANVLMACVILHNKVIDDEQREVLELTIEL